MVPGTDAGGADMEIFLVRHGIAVDREGDGPDAFRPLTGKGRRRFRKTARSFARLGCKLDLILTSPLVRAVQTAEILAGETKHGDVAVLEELDPKFDANDLLKALAKRANGSRSVAIVGHEPQLSSVLATLAAVEAENLDLKKGGIVRLEIAAPSRRGSAEAIWSLKPRSKTVKKGLPLTKSGDGEENSEERVAKGKERKRSRRKKRAARSDDTAAEARDAVTTAEATADAEAATAPAESPSEDESETTAPNAPEPSRETNDAPPALA
jgi:phosphohistidine phosphatase